MATTLRAIWGAAPNDMWVVGDGYMRGVGNERLHLAGDVTGGDDELNSTGSGASGPNDILGGRRAKGPFCTVTEPLPDCAIRRFRVVFPVPDTCRGETARGLGQQGGCARARVH